MSSQPKVLIDFERLKHIHSGLGQVSLHLAGELSRRTSDSWQPVYLVPPGWEGQFGSRVEYEVASARRRLLPRLCPRYDLWHATHQESRYTPGHVGTPYVLTIHDLNFLEEKAGGKADRRLRRLQFKADRASAITFVSDYTRRLAEQRLQLPDVPLEVIWNGAGSAEHPVAGRRPAWAPEGKFLFSLGLIRPRKNFHVLVDMVSRLPAISLVIAGNTEHSYAGEIREHIRQRNLEARVHLPGEVSAAEKAWLFENCEAFVFPSTLEGFGLPVVEAMSYGKPVFLSNRTSLPEVGGTEARYWESFEPDHMVEVFRAGMEEFRQDSGKRERVIRQGRRFSWSEAASSYLALYLRLLRGVRPIPRASRSPART